jgi:hypothetical protein
MSYTIVKIKSSYKDTITLLLKELIGFNIEVIEKDDYLLYKYDFFNIDDIKALILSFASEQMINIFCFSTITSNPDLELELCLNLFNKYNNGFYSIKELLINDLSSFNKKEVLDLILNSTGINEDFIKEYVKYDLNISKASKEMFIHRNTMNYKLDKLKELSGFDLRSFNDAYILYSLINNK